MIDVEVAIEWFDMLGLALNAIALTILLGDAAFTLYVRLVLGMQTLTHGTIMWVVVGLLTTGSVVGASGLLCWILSDQMAASLTGL